ncbi:MAG: substrate-binding domain-containing protein [Alphaproteobacteria bacterium]|nr:substrate-binding domain-containing protein [Alphaproteobacteria bacterium]
MRVPIVRFAGALALALAAAVAHAAPAPGAPQVFPPWQEGRNNDAVDRGLQFTVPEVDTLADFHGDLTDPKLVLFVGGNYFFAMAPLVAAFEAEHPQFKGRLYWETLPPGILEAQMKAGGRITCGNMTWKVSPDAYLAGLRKVNDLIAEGMLEGPATPYVTNDLTIMVPAGNPAGIKSLADLGRSDLRLAMPNPKFEGVARQIQAALGKAGGPQLVRRVYEEKVKDGSTVLTQVHHRQTPLFLMQGKAQAGVTWTSEALFQEEVGNPIGHVAIPAAQNATAIYAGAAVKGAAHADAARLWLEFIRSPKALAIFARYGFKPHVGPPPAGGE